MLSSKSQSLIFSIGLFLCLFISPGCSSLLPRLYGIKSVKKVDEKAIIKSASKFNIHESEIYELDPSYFTFLQSFDTNAFHNQIKNHSQPLQALYFDRSGKLISFHINCYAGGFPNLHWGDNKVMDSFPPALQAPLDSLLTLKTQLKYLRPASQVTNLNPDIFDYVVVVYWNKFMGRQSKRLIKAVQENSQLARDLKVKILYVNSDNAFAGL